MLNGKSEITILREVQDQANIKTTNTDKRTTWVDASHTLIYSEGAVTRHEFLPSSARKHLQL
jgi:hypothetical protein